MAQAKMGARYGSGKGIKQNLALSFKYREMAAFAQFGSDLDTATQRQLARGQRLMEILKQPQYTPVEMENQVFVIYAANSGKLDEIPLNKISQFESGFGRFLSEKHADLVKEVASTGKLEAGAKSKLDAAIEEYKKQFVI